MTYDVPPTRQTSPAAAVTPPVAPKHPFVRSFHGYDFDDPYEWLREKTSPETIEYLEAENAYTDEVTAPLHTLRDNLFQEMKSRIKETDMSVPVRSGNWWYFSRTEEGKSYGTSCRVPVSGDPQSVSSWQPPAVVAGEALPGEEVLLDLNELAEGHDFFSVGASSVTTTGRLLAYSVDTTGDERFDLRIKDLETGKLLPDELKDLFYGATWVGESHLFYTRVDKSWRPNAIWRHTIGTPVDNDECIFIEDDEKFNVSVFSVLSEKYLIIDSSSSTTSEVWILDTSDPEGAFTCLRPRETGIEYGIDHAVVAGEDRWLVLHNAHGPNFELSEHPVAYGPIGSFDDLTTLIPHRPQVRLSAVDCHKNFILLGYRAGGIGRVSLATLHPESGYGTFDEITCDEELYTLSPSGNPEWDQPVIRLGYTSFTTPSQVWNYDIATGEKTLLKEQEIPGGYTRDDYTATRLWANAADGTRIPLSLVHRADLDLSVPHPLNLYGYGSYEASMDPGFSVTALSSFDRGMILCVAHIRGGGEMGRAWYDAGKELHKMNTFTDFLAAADFLIERGITTPDQMVASGGSAGGLLMGAVANLGGDRFTAIHADVPFVDPLTSMLMPELPLTTGEWEEWGDPYHDKTFYEYMASYSPYENIAAKHYPDILATTSLNDTRVLYVEPAKWIAKLRATATGGEFLLKTEMAAGHGGVSGRYEKWKQMCFKLAWIINKATGLCE